MTFADVTLLLTTMILLAATPSASVALVVSRAAAFGVRSGAATAAGIVLGDFVFVAVALFGLSSLAQTLGPAFIAVKILGGSYLIYTGIRLVRRPTPSTALTVPTQPPRTAHLTSFVAGFLLTLGDAKAILFYASLFPTVVDVASLTAPDIAAIFGVTFVTVGGVKLAYAFAARRITTRLAAPRLERGLQRVTGGVMIGAGTWLIAKT